MVAGGAFDFKRIRSHYNLQLFLCSALLTLSSFNYGFDNQGFAQTQAMDSFIKQFGNYNASTKTYAIPSWLLSLFNSLVFIGFAIGVAIGSIVSARYGRRMTVFCQSLWAFVSATIIISSTTQEQMLIGRILNYIYVGMELSVIPVFQAEIMPKEVRGFAVGSYQLSISWGGLIINIICRGTSNIQSNAAWRIPFGCYYIIPAIIASLIWFIPESPRYLLSKGRPEEARAALSRIRVDNSPDAIEEEVGQILLALEAEKDQGTYRELFQGTNLRRTMIVCGSNVCLQITGQSFGSAYGTIFIKSLNTINAFDMAVVNQFLRGCAVLSNMYFVDYVGRRKVFMLGTGMQSICLFIMGGMGLIATQTASTKATIVAFSTLNDIFFSGFLAPTNYMITTEMPEQKLRDKTVRVGSWVNIFSNFVIAFTVPYLLNAPYADLGSKVGFIYGPLAVMAFLFCFFFVPECKGRSLEEVDLLFHHKISALKSVNWEAPPITQELSDIAHGGDDKAVPEMEHMEETKEKVQTV